MNNNAASLDQLLDRHRQQLQLLNFSLRTIQTNFSSLRQFRQYLAEMGINDLRAVDTAAINDFLSWLMNQPSHRGTPRTVSTQNRVLTAIKGFFAFLVEEGHLARDPADKVFYAREPHYLPRNVLTVAEARQIIELPDLQTVRGYRDRTILEVFYATGIRKGEMMNLELKDIQLEEGLLRINGGKGNKDRVVPLTRLACSFLENYINAVRPELLGAGQTTRLFVSSRQRPMGKNTLGALVEKYGRLSGVRKHVTCHLWRHTCATHLVQRRANLRHVQEIMGHRLLSTTERYLHLTISDLKEAHRKYHPRENELK